MSVRCPPSARSVGDVTSSRFHEALATAIDVQQFAHVPVDWWDASAARWRPTVVERTCDSDTGRRTHVNVMVPVPEGEERNLVIVMPRRVSITNVRPSQLLDEGIAQFFTTRYTLEMLESLMPCVNRVALEEQMQLRGVIDELHQANLTAYATWMRAFAEGAADDVVGSTAPWLERALDESRLPRVGAHDVFSAIDRGRDAGEIHCSPVALWDETARCWRPTMMLDAATHDPRLEPYREDQVLVPGEPVDVAVVPATLIQPIDIADTCFSLLAIPVLARDYLRMHEALRSAGLSSRAVAAHPSMIAFARMLHGAADEWRGVYEEGLLGPEPQPRVQPLHPSLWGFTSDGIEALSGDDSRH
jgi:hypothetical protein